MSTVGKLLANRFVEWTRNGGCHGRRSLMLSAPLWPTHSQRWAS